MISAAPASLPAGSRRSVWVFALLLVLCVGPGRAEVAVPPLAARVTDLTATLAAPERQALEEKLAAFEQAKGSQIAVLIVPTTHPETVEQYGIRVVEQWKLGRKEVDDGALLLVAKDDRTVRIEVGYGLEGVIPDAVAKRVIEEIIVPRFREGDFAGGLDAGVEAPIGLASGEPLPAPRRPGASVSAGLFENALSVAFVLLFFMGPVLRMLFGRLPGAAVAGAVTFFAAWLLLGGLLVALALALVVFVLTLTGVGRPGGFRGGGFGGGGGFSGGGGGFGGGGASGRW